MRCLAFLLAAVSALSAQSPQVKRGAEIFRTTCGVAYCHGAEGAAGRAPQLAGRNFNSSELFATVLNGIRGTSMPAFSHQMKTEDIEAVTQYVLSLSGHGGPAAFSARRAVQELPPGAEKGRVLFFDAVRMGGCGKCHEVGDRGAAVGSDLSALVATRFVDLRSVAAKNVVTATIDGEDSFPALVVEETPERVQVYDLSSALPVLRTLRPAEVHMKAGSEWSHAAQIQSYSDNDLAAISGYLTYLAGTRRTQ